MDLHVFLGGLSLDAAVVLLTLGIALIYYELNLPGSVLPGALGLLIVLLSVAALGRRGINPVAVMLILSAFVLLALSLVRPIPMLMSIAISTAATVALVLGLLWLSKYSCCASIEDRVHTPVAVVCGLALGAGTSVLTRIAHRARVNKGIYKKRMYKKV